MLAAWASASHAEAAPKKKKPPTVAENVIRRLTKLELINEMLNVNPINELGDGDWKVEALHIKLSKLTPKALQEVGMMLFGNKAYKCDNLMALINHEIREMGKADVDHLYANIIGV
jgi:hypothetical protein